VLNSENAPKPFFNPINFLIFYLLLVVLLLVTALLIRQSPQPAIVPGSEVPKSVKPTISKPTSAPYRYISSTPKPTPKISSIKQFPVSGKSPGLYYPTKLPPTINNSTPTIIGKMSQYQGFYLDSKYGIETSPVSLQDANFIRIFPGKIDPELLRVSIDSGPPLVVYGFSQYPTFYCGELPFEECLEQNRMFMPYLIFITKAKSPISPGKHVLNINGKYGIASMTFNVDLDYRLPVQDIYRVDANHSYYSFDSMLVNSDTCAPGYYYDNNYLKMPLPEFKNDNLLYTLYFPKSATELGKSSHQVKIKFGNETFDLFFPSAKIFYLENTQEPEYNLFLPKDYLVFPDGTQANYVKNLLEVFPVDVSGGLYPNSSFLWQMSSSSWCDG